MDTPCCNKETTTETTDQDAVATATCCDQTDCCTDDAACCDDADCC